MYIHIYTLYIRVYFNSSNYFSYTALDIRIADGAI